MCWSGAQTAGLPPGVMWGILQTTISGLGETLLKRAFLACALALTVTTLSLASYQAGASEVVYRWNDAQGNPVNSDRPPPKGTDYEVISTKSSMVRPVDAAEGAVPLETKPRVGNEFQPVDSNTPKEVKNAEFCQRARENLSALDANVRIKMRDAQGEIYYLSMEEREVQRKKAVDTIKAHCEQT
jgi:hypothetical protein